MALKLICLLACLLPVAETDHSDTLVICPPAFHQALKPWLEYRKQQGYKIRVVQPASTSTGVKAQIKQVAEHGALKNIVIIGDAADSRSNPVNLVPTAYVEAKVNVKFGSEPEIATDNAYADINDDGVVDLTIGRIPVDSAEELSGFINRIIAHERKSSSGPWQRRVNFVAGVGGFGEVVDKMIEQSVKKIVTDLIPPQFDTSMTYGSWRSPYCPDPRRFSQTAINRFNEGCLFWVYIGHGDRQRLDRLQLPDRRYSILNNNTVSSIRAVEGGPIAIFLSCYTASIDDQSDGLAETMLKQSNGPIGIISSSRVSMPYALSLFSLEMLDGYFDGKVSTLGELVKQSKQKLVSAPVNRTEYHLLIESMGTAFSPEPGLLKEERVDHVHLMHLLGDPLLKLRRPEKLPLHSPAESKPGQTIQITGTANRAGTLTIDLSYRRDRFRNRPPRRKHYDSSDESFSGYQKVYEQTQNLICNCLQEQIPAGPFSVELCVPDNCSGACHIRGMLNADSNFALGANEIHIHK